MKERSGNGGGRNGQESWEIYETSVTLYAGEGGE